MQIGVKEGPFPRGVKGLGGGRGDQPHIGRLGGTQSGWHIVIPLPSLGIRWAGYLCLRRRAWRSPGRAPPIAVHAASTSPRRPLPAGAQRGPGVPRVPQPQRRGSAAAGGGAAGGAGGGGGGVRGRAGQGGRADERGGGRGKGQGAGGTWARKRGGIGLCAGQG